MTDPAHGMIENRACLWIMKLMKCSPSAKMLKEAKLERGVFCPCLSYVCLHGSMKETVYEIVFFSLAVTLCKKRDYIRKRSPFL